MIPLIFTVGSLSHLPGPASFRLLTNGHARCMGAVASRSCFSAVVEKGKTVPLQRTLITP
jgi:hypothetical protein